MIGDQILSPLEVQKLLNISEPTLRRWSAVGKFPAKIPIGYRDTGYLKTDVMAWIERHGQRVPASNGSAPTLGAVVVFKYPQRFKRASEAEHVAAAVRALGARIEQDAAGFYVVTVPSNRPAATEKYLRSQFPHATWERLDVDGTDTQP